MLARAEEGLYSVKWGYEGMSLGSLASWFLLHDIGPALLLAVGVESKKSVRQNRTVSPGMRIC